MFAYFNYECFIGYCDLVVNISVLTAWKDLSLKWSYYASQRTLNTADLLNLASTTTESKS